VGLRSTEAGGLLHGRRSPKDLDPDGKTIDAIDMPIAVSRDTWFSAGHMTSRRQPKVPSPSVWARASDSAPRAARRLLCRDSAFDVDRQLARRCNLCSIIGCCPASGLAGSACAGTWLVAEVDGEFAAKLSARFGYRYNWLRNLGLAGFPGYRPAHPGCADATIGWARAGNSSSSRHAIHWIRETGRPRALEANARSGWEFALNASVGVTGRRRIATG